MDPQEIKLTLRQKVKPLLIAINNEVPWQFMVITVVAITIGIMIGVHVPALFVTPFLDIIFRIIIGAVSTVTSWFIIGTLWMFIEEQCKPLIDQIKKNYKEEALIIKRDILDNVVEDEILKK